MKASVRVALPIAVIVCALGVLAVVVSPSVPGRTRITAIYAGNAELAAVSGPPAHEATSSRLSVAGDPQQCYDLLVRPHNMQGGSAVVVAEYKLENPRLLTFDDESFQFLSIQIPTRLAGHQVSLPAEGVDIRFSRGGEFHFLKCEGEWGIEPRGSISTTVNDDGTLSVVADVEMKSIDAKRHRENRPVRVHEVFVARRVMPTTGPATISPAFLAFQRRGHATDLPQQEH